MTPGPVLPEGWEPRLTAEDFSERWLRSPVGAGLALPWFDPVALWLLGRWFFPLSRLWAAARAANGSLLKFYGEVPMDPIPGIGARLRKTLDRFETAREAVNATEARWRQVFFDERGSELYRLGGDRGGEARPAQRLQRHAAAFFLSQAPAVDPAGSLGRAERGRGRGRLRRLAGRPGRRLRALPAVSRDRRIAARARAVWGEEYWLRFRSPSPVMNDDVFARVYEPIGVTDPPTLSVRPRESASSSTTGTGWSTRSS